MNRSTIRLGILVFSLITALIHLFLGINFRNVLFILNSLGFLVFLVGVLRPPAILSGQSHWVHYGFIAYTAITIIAWLVQNGDFTSLLGVGTKLDELLLISALWLHLRSSD